MVTAEEHQVGGFGNIVAGALLCHRQRCSADLFPKVCGSSAAFSPLLFDMLGVDDCFGLSGKPWDLVRAFGLSAEHIAERVLSLRERRRVAVGHR
jgi:transketolase